jgi:hypothetical protein
MEGESCILALLRSNITFCLTSIKPFYIRDIKAGSNGPEHNPEYHVEGEDDGEGNGGIGIIPPTISTNIPPKRGRG